MNPQVIRDNLKKHIGERVKIKVYGMRNKTDILTGILTDIYPQIFTINTSYGLKSYSYSELINKEVELTFI